MHVRFRIILVAILFASGCAGRLANRPDLYQAEKVEIERQHYHLHPVLVKPVNAMKHPLLVVFASGDAGLLGLSKAIFQHLADRGYYVVGFSSREALHEIKGSRQRVPYHEAVENIIWMTSEAKKQLGLPDETPIVVTGLSRGANMAVLSASADEMKNSIAGGVAIGLTREFDYVSLKHPSKTLPGAKLDEKQRVQAYSVINHIGAIPFAIIQSTTDDYVPSAESRQLLGPDTPTRRLYEVKANGHRFGGAEKQLLSDLDDAMNWIVSR